MAFYHAMLSLSNPQAVTFKGLLNKILTQFLFSIKENFSNKLQLSISCGDISILEFFFRRSKKMNVSNVASQFKFQKSLAQSETFEHFSPHTKLEHTEKRRKTENQTVRKIYI